MADNDSDIEFVVDDEDGEEGSQAEADPTAEIEDSTSEARDVSEAVPPPLQQETSSDTATTTQAAKKVLHVTDGHPGKFQVAGKYFGIARANAEEVFGSTEWNAKVFPVNVGDREGKVILWRYDGEADNNLKMDAGRWEPGKEAKEGQWKVGDQIVLQVEEETLAPAQAAISEASWSVTVSTSSGKEYTVAPPSVGAKLWSDGEDVFNSLGGFTEENGFKYIRCADADKDTPSSTVQFTLTSSEAFTVYLVYSGDIPTDQPHDEARPWIDEEEWKVTTDFAMPSASDPLMFPWNEVRVKTFASGTAEIKGNNGDDLGAPVVFVNKAAPKTTISTDPAKHEETLEGASSQPVQNEDTKEEKTKQEQEMRRLHEEAIAKAEEDAAAAKAAEEKREAEEAEAARAKAEKDAAAEKAAAERRKAEEEEAAKARKAAQENERQELARREVEQKAAKVLAEKVPEEKKGEKHEETDKTVDQSELKRKEAEKKAAAERELLRKKTAEKLADEKAKAQKAANRQAFREKMEAASRAREEEALKELEMKQSRRATTCITDMSSQKGQPPPRGDQKAMVAGRHATLHAHLSQLAAFLRDSKEGLSQSRQEAIAGEQEMEELEQETKVWKQEAEGLTIMAARLEKQLQERVYAPGSPSVFASSPGGWQRRSRGATSPRSTGHFGGYG